MKGLLQQKHVNILKKNNELGSESSKLRAGCLKSVHAIMNLMGSVWLQKKKWMRKVHDDKVKINPCSQLLRKHQIGLAEGARHIESVVEDRPSMNNLIEVKTGVNGSRLFSTSSNTPVSGLVAAGRYRGLLPRNE